jgi:GTPase SAR1 family protein
MASQVMEPDISGAMSVAGMDSESPEQIYAYVTDGVDDVISALEVQAEDAEDAAVQSGIMDDLRVMQAEVAKQQEELRASAEWKDFTVALYGETNAGKSTLIESLRIHLEEETKLEQRRRFDELQAVHGLDDAALQAAHEAVDQARAAAAEASAYGKRLDEGGQAQLQALEEEKARLAQEMLAAHASRFWWQKLIGLFRRSEEAAAYDSIRARITAFRVQQQREHQQAEVGIADAEAGLKKAEENLGRRLGALPLLIEYADGSIIGDGRPDFTTQTQRYHFNTGEASFVLLDVPGIEGNEAKVNAHIGKAVQTAHAVFYVVRKAARPQHGDKEDGTLEKIKYHLGPQTEVWAVFNKPITSPMAFQNTGSLFTRDSDGIADLEQGMREALGAHYKGILPVSVYPAFLALADRLPPERKPERAKFLAKYDVETILDRSAFFTLAGHLTSMAIGAPAKIRQANIHKACLSLHQSVKNLDRLAGTMEAHAQKVIAETTDVQGQVDKAAQKLGSSLRTDAGDALRALETNVRRKIYTQIEACIGNDKLKAELQSSLETHVPAMQREVESKFKAASTQFQNAIANAAERFQKHLKDLGEIAGAQMREVSGPSFNLALRVDNGVNIAGLVATAVGVGALLLSNPAGWVVITLSVVGVVLSLAKALWSLLDDDFKKSQQRKAVDENLSKAVTSLKRDLEASEKSVLDAVKAAAAEAKERLGEPQRNVKSQAAILRRSADRLKALSIKIETTMA